MAVVVSSSSAWLMDGGSSLPVCRPVFISRIFVSTVLYVYI